MTSSLSQPSAFAIPDPKTLATMAAQMSLSEAKPAEVTPSQPSPKPPSPVVIKAETIEEKLRRHSSDADEPVITVLETTEIAVALTPFKAQSGEQLSLEPRDYVKIRKKSSKGWWEGEIQVRAHRCWFSS